MQLLKNGSKLCLALSLVLSGACRNSVPPKLSIICLGDGVGGADCSRSDGSNVHLLPSELLNYWMTTNADIANYSSWCNETSVNVVTPIMTAMEKKMKR